MQMALISPILHAALGRWLFAFMGFLIQHTLGGT
jgi:hypothetical protein